MGSSGFQFLGVWVLNWENSTAESWSHLETPSHTHWVLDAGLGGDPTWNCWGTGMWLRTNRQNVSGSDMPHFLIQTSQAWPFVFSTYQLNGEDFKNLEGRLLRWEMSGSLMTIEQSPHHSALAGDMHEKYLLSSAIYIWGCLLQQWVLLILTNNHHQSFIEVMNAWRCSDGETWHWEHPWWFFSPSQLL